MVVECSFPYITLSLGTANLEVKIQMANVNCVWKMFYKQFQDISLSAISTHRRRLLTAAALENIVNELHTIKQTPQRSMFHKEVRAEPLQDMLYLKGVINK